MAPMKAKPLLTVAIIVLLSGVGASSSLRASAEGDDLRAADAELNEAYQTALGAVPSENKAKLREAQRAWIAYRDAEVSLYAELGRGGGGLKIVQTELTEERTKRLKGIAQDARDGGVQ